jgi:VCBS repeat-containing protein
VILQAHASGTLLREACAFNETLKAAFHYGKMSVVQKGVYHFKTHQEANDHQAQILTDTTNKWGQTRILFTQGKQKAISLNGFLVKRRV